ncbi:bifunctional aspartate kinase/homoserine dehydrogenase I [Luteibaculum oceani]|uniref:Homoserine O-acetyltransferase n=1 Tax=Luteibaculum oceani TaxID=1294296 RepID=A0A5C6VFE9_9FLAO|nr:bifunctional aspartate kinase/homoserine dehydrogenase I [Luteibaculum oceani]TXC82028.1 bifunctional aspartate kinase/homoserine dehydrogenase I [Luteibaculum oceani]
MNIYKYHSPFKLENGQQLDELKLAYHTYGKLNKDKSNVVWAFHALTANSDVLDWWKGLFGEDYLFNPQDYFIICVNSIGSPYGSSSPKDLSFPQFTVRDLANAYQLLAKQLEINHINCLIGGSFGGYQALEFAYSFTGKVDNLILVATSARESAWGIAIHEAQRLALMADGSFGKESGGWSGMRAARSAALLSYRTIDKFIETQTDEEEKIDAFKAASYVQYQGDKFVKRFKPLSYYYLSKCLDSHNIGRGRGGEIHALSKIDIPTLVIGISSDGLIPTRLQKALAKNLPNATYHEIESDYGHDGFLTETKKLSLAISNFIAIDKTPNHSEWKVLKFGGKSLANGQPIQEVIQILKDETKSSKDSIAVVVSARGSSTNNLLDLIEKAKAGISFKEDLDAFFDYQTAPVKIELAKEKKELKQLLEAIAILGTADDFTTDLVLSYGELIAAKTIATLLNSSGVKSTPLDARELIFTHKLYDDFEVNLSKSKAATLAVFENIKPNHIPVVTGFIGSSETGKTITLGRNGSNYSATLIASFLNAKEIVNWTDVDGVYSASPKFVDTAVRISHMSYRQANELANFGANVLHPKTILPLMQANIPLRIKSTFNPKSEGTLITKKGSEKGIKAVSSLDDVALIAIEGDGLLGNVGIDGRIFSVLTQAKISVRLISQASSERGIGFVVNQDAANLAESLLRKEFKQEIELGSIASIRTNKDVAIVAIVGRHNYSLEKAIHGLRRNKIWMHLISNSISGEHISLVIDRVNLAKAVNVVHNQVFGASKTLNVFAFGKGNVGGKLIDQIIETDSATEKKRNLKIKVIGVADSNNYIFNKGGISKNWRELLGISKLANSVDDILRDIKESGLENVVIADNTSAQEISSQYPRFIREGYDLVASNKKFNSGPIQDYLELRKDLRRGGRAFLYETNVGAGLPIIDTLRQMHNSADRITRIRGVFSGSLSYIFNTFSSQELPFYDVLLEAKNKGLTEPDPREDLCGLDVARKLIILAREVGLEVELGEVEVKSLIPPKLNNLESAEAFLDAKEELNNYFGNLKSNLKTGEVLRYVGDLDVERKTLKVDLVKAAPDSALAQVKNADSLFEIYSESYGAYPIVVQGAGAGAAVTARGVYSDIIRIGAKI